METQRPEIGMIGLGVMGRNSDFPNYAGGTWGPDAMQGLLVQQGHCWPAPVELAGPCK